MNSRDFVPDKRTDISTYIEMHSGYRIRNQESIHFITFAVVEWVDVFTRKEYAEIIVESLEYCQKEKGLIEVDLFFLFFILHL